MLVSCGFAPFCLVHARVYKSTAADKLREAMEQLKLGDLRCPMQKPQSYFPSMVNLTKLHDSPDWHYTDQPLGMKTGERVSMQQEYFLLCWGPNGKTTTLNVFLCFTCTASTAIALCHLVCFFQGETVRITSPCPPVHPHTLLASFLPRETVWLPPDLAHLHCTANTVTPAL